MITDAVLITIYAAQAVLIVAAAMSFRIYGMHQELSSAYYWISACVLCWLFMTFAYHITSDPWLIEYMDNLTFPFVAFLPVVLLRFTLCFYQSDISLTKRRVILLSIIPATTTVISVVPSLNWLLRSDYNMIQIYPLHIPDYTWNVWYYIHAGYSYILIAICCLLVIWQYKSQPRGYKIPSILMIAGIAITVLGDLPSFQMPDSVIDNTLVGVCLSMVALHFAIATNPALAFLTAARKALYNNMDLPVFIIDRQEYILDMNLKARSMMETIGARNDEIQSMAFGDVASVISNFGGMVKEGYAGDGLPHIFLPLNGENVVFKQIRRELNDKRGKPLGSYVVMMDITGLRRTVDELQYKVEVDVLTGIPNRRAFDHKSAKMDIPENLPLSIIVGDVNRLKQVNDELGHQQGDVLLKTVAGVLQGACPNEGFVARIGGDEFVIVIPHCSADEAQIVADGIHMNLKNEEKHSMGASIALGCVTKTEHDQDIDALIHEADQLMYSQKKYDRRRRR